ncbi:MAG: FAD-binding protein [Kiritimatiellia bacterium]|jgi:L-aspartate oxidase|nr:FAD-binding protein [Kiritimatiellia bacterium]
MDQFDVVVVGGGLAGVCAAEQALRSGAETALVSKGEIGEIGVRGAGASGCGTTEWGVPSFYRLLDESFDADDFRDMIINAGLGVVERDMVSFFVEEFVKMKSSAEDIMNCYQRPGTFSPGTPLVRACLDSVRKGAKVHCRTTAAQLLVKDNVCHGVLCVDECTGETFPLYGKAVILAAGGDAGLFSVNVHPECVSGDGYALGLNGGAEAINLEFMQIFTTTAAPTRNLIHFVKEEYLSNLYNSEEGEFLPRYLPEGITREECIRENILHAPFSVRDRASRYLAIGIVEEIKAGRATPSGGIYVDLRNCPSFRDTAQHQFLLGRGVDASQYPVEVTMGFQCCNGGLRVNRNMETTVAGLYAAGENAGGLHGADRIGGNMLAGCMISGRIAGEQAAAYAQTCATVEKLPYQPKMLIAGAPGLASKYAHLVMEIRQSAWDDLLVIKSKSSINSFHDRIEEIAEEARVTANDPASLPVELENLLALGKALARTTLEREESRGGFYRDDCPDSSPDIPEAHILAMSEEGEVSLRKEILDPQWNPGSRNMLDKERWG